MPTTEPTTLDLDALEALLAKATPGPWRALRDGNQFIGSTLVGASRLDGPPRPTFLGDGHNANRFTDEDGDLIADLHNAAPELLAAARERATLRAALVEAREVLALCTSGGPQRSPVDDAARTYGAAYGLGALMAATSHEWAEMLRKAGMPPGSEHTCGPCAATVERALGRIDAALAGAAK